MQEHWEEVTILINKFRDGTFLSPGNEKDLKRDKKILGWKLRKLAPRDKAVRGQRSRAVRYFSAGREKSGFHVKITPSCFKSEVREHAIALAPYPEKLSDLSGYIVCTEPSSVKKCVGAIFTGSSLASSFKGTSYLQEGSRLFSEVKRLRKEKSDGESHKVLNPRVNLAVLNI